MRLVFSYWCSIAWQALTEAGRHAFDKQQVIKEAVILVVAIAASKWVLQLQAKEISGNVEWAFACILGTIVVFIFMVMWNLVSIPARRDYEQTKQLHLLRTPEFPVLSEGQRAILRLCIPASEATVYKIVVENHVCKINKKPILKQDGDKYWYQTVFSEAKHMCQHGVIEIVDDRWIITGFRFRLTRLGVIMVEKADELCRVPCPSAARAC